MNSKRRQNKNKQEGQKGNRKGGFEWFVILTGLTAGLCTEDSSRSRSNELSEHSHWPLCMGSRSSRLVTGLLAKSRSLCADLLTSNLTKPTHSCWIPASMPRVCRSDSSTSNGLQFILTPSNYCFSVHQYTEASIRENIRIGWQA